MRAHSCRSLLCETPHYDEGYCDHWEDCSHYACHRGTHDFTTWNVYPECTYCEEELLDYWEEELRAA